MMLGTTLASVTMNSKLLSMQNGFSVVYFEEYNAKETTVHVSDHTVNHCIPQMNSQCSTAESMMVLGSTLTSVTMYSKLLVMQNGPSVVYFEECNAKGDYCDMCQGTQLTAVGPK